MLIAITVLHNLKIYQMNIKIAFLNGKLNEKICMENPKVTFVYGQRKCVKIIYIKKKSVRLLNYFMNQNSMLQK